MVQKAGAKSGLICTSFFLLGRKSFSGWSTEYFLRQQTSGICKFCLFQTMGTLLESSQSCVGFPSLFCDQQNLQKEFSVLEMLENQQTNYSSTVWDCGYSTHAPQVLCKPGLFIKHTQRGYCMYSKPGHAHNTCWTNSACANGPFMHASVFQIFATSALTM